MLRDRDYNLNGLSQIDFYKDRIEFYNPGGLIKGLKKEDLGKIKKSYPRNLFLFSELYGMNLVDSIGFGLNKVFKSLKSLDIDFKIDSSEDYFKFTIYRRRNNFNTKTLKNIENGTINGTIKREDKKKHILEILNINHGLNSRQLIEMTKFKERTIKRYLKELTDEGSIEFRGSNKTGGYYLKDS